MRSKKRICVWVDRQSWELVRERGLSPSEICDEAIRLATDGAAFRAHFAEVGTEYEKLRAIIERDDSHKDRIAASRLMAPLVSRYLQIHGRTLGPEMEADGPKFQRTLEEFLTSDEEAQRFMRRAGIVTTAADMKRLVWDRLNDPLPLEAAR